MSGIDDPEVQILASCAGVLQNDYDDDDGRWKDSPFAWIRNHPSRTKGTIGEKLVAGYLATKGFDVTRSPDHEADRIVNGRRVEIKMSTLWRDSGSYRFQQLRDQNYEFALCLGISPFDAHCWVLPKSIIMDQWGNGIKFQHGGSSGNDTAWLSVDPGKVPQWLYRRGGRLSDAVPIVGSLTGLEPLP